MSADIITRKFRTSREITHRLSNLAADEFKNGLAGKHFARDGDLISRQFQQPTNADIVLQRESVHSYDVLSVQYSYKDKEFWLNQITGDGHSKYVTAGLPLSGKKVAIAALAVCAVVGVLAALAIVF